MLTYLKSIRLKISVLTLLMACVFAVGCVRSRIINDFISFDTVCSECVIESNIHGIMLVVLPLPTRASYTASIWPTWCTTQSSAEGYPAPEEWDFVSRYDDWIGIKNMRRQFPDGDESTVWIVPYWSIVIPLTLLSAYLVLSKSRVSKPGPINV